MELESEHYAVDVSGGGKQSPAIASEFDYDLVVRDLNLPGLDGVAISGVIMVSSVTQGVPRPLWSLVPLICLPRHRENSR
jgi:DNA-binding response OmpR family regulator